MLAACPPLAVLVEQVRTFADLLTTRRGDDLEDGMSAVEASDLPALHAFVRGYARTSTPSFPGYSTTCSYATFSRTTPSGGGVGAGGRLGGSSRTAR